MSAPEDFKRVSDILGDVFDGVAAQDTGGRISQHASLTRALAVAWPEVVGEEVAENASPMQLKNGTLVVSTSSSVWADSLSYMGADLAARLNQRLGQEAVRQILFRHAGWEELPSTVRRRPST